MKPIGGMRTVTCWVRYLPGNAYLIGKGYRTKKLALSKQRVGEVVFKLKGHYFPLTAKKRPRRSLSENEHG